MKILVLVLLYITFVFGDTIVTVATYNVENLFDLQKNGYEYQEYIPNGPSKWNQKTYNAKLENISQVIKDIDADIIAIEEIESLEALKDLRFALKQKGLYYQYFKISDSKNTTTKVAILSKIPFIYAKEVSVTSSYKYRNILEVKFKINNQELYLFVNHWKAKNGAENQRIISAKALINRIKQIGYDKNIILVGDFNSDYEEYKKFQRNRKLNDTNGKTGINHVLKTLDQTTAASKTKYREYNFYNLWYDTREDERFSYIFRKKKEALDSILISQSLLKNGAVHYKEGSIASFRANYLFKGKNIYRWQTSRKKPYMHKAKGYSDHLPVVAKFVIVN